jgi:hypothetical protein
MTGDEKPEDGLLEALRHPLRRTLLKLCLEAEKMLSPKDLALLVNHPVLSNVAYHVRVLKEHGALDIVHEKPVRGAVAHYYRPTRPVAGTPWVRAVIGLPLASQEASSP